eukprot:CAMPEP_0116902484 /NCGR_PEP_ID=MMETSP0467-20121206/10067_1 /TAXON_ID=283647 /ORGANISM="Mesodinium pulex, Strain SPMC105" /LENGTH=115 /DNA_ID=CAMNT_0004576379 /DNA_START=150 /DNA_END=498 /DNA_ORIENTATION=+
MANVNLHYLPPQQMKGWRSPGIVQALPAFMPPPTPGAVTEANEVATDDLYYNGSFNLGQAVLVKPKPSVTTKPHADGASLLSHVCKEIPKVLWELVPEAMSTEFENHFYTDHNDN